jgi:type VI protein secretion system component Hcp
MGRHGEAIAEMRKARSLDPLSLIINVDLAEALLIAHFYDESVIDRMSLTAVRSPAGQMYTLIGWGPR